VVFYQPLLGGLAALQSQKSFGSAWFGAGGGWGWPRHKMARGKSHRLVAGAALLAACLLCTPLLAADSSPRPDYLEAQPLTNRICWFAGGDVASDSHFAWSGIGGALSQSLHEDGARFRVTGSIGRYRYRTGAVAGGINEGRVTSGEVLIGLQRTYG